MDAPIRDDATTGVAGLPVTLRNPDELAAFLRTHPGASGVVRAVADRLPHYFPGDPLVLDVEIDPDGAQVDTLFVVVRSIRPPREAVATLHRFDREWWIPFKTRQRLPVVVTVEPV